MGVHSGDCNRGSGDSRRDSTSGSNSVDKIQSSCIVNGNGIVVMVVIIIYRKHDTTILH